MWLSSNVILWTDPHPKINNYSHVQTLVQSNWGLWGPPTKINVDKDVKSYIKFNYSFVRKVWLFHLQIFSEKQYMCVISRIQQHMITTWNQVKTLQFSFDI